MPKSKPSVTQMNNEYVQSKAKDEKRHQKFKLIFRRRVLFYSAVATLVIGILVFNLVKQQHLLATNKKQSTELQTKYNHLMQQETAYKEQVEQLKDPEYVAKLARSEYYLSKNGEIIFTIPSKKD
ncbi:MULTISPECIES: FtsB family cell division protein [Brochothrix]|uniref:Putative septum formation initiator DivIC n=1 Tax=Brochothrix thermosphacta TaxID=2756 RepID=A0A1D2M0B4_BROTH|nr:MULTISPECIES: septum formation initiator family protein [Brochothrix]SLM93584.1 Cell division protein DivIC (FtsB), stabilizes FtsL against RasP cleavage [Brachybacterium faecium]ANZ95087.1 hypothetical protein BFC19_06745 [Brochothrix thermosphacta]ANZ96609.1 hypothetical protein BFC20_02035 [Brochothrix thermosphacta]ATF26027.1 hypothetical protein CNY62_06205 [Brochothrix thermosphacta]ATH85367.1 hypothetical protein CPF12_05795 [Brochothrix thermosphacta]